MRKGF